MYKMIVKDNCPVCENNKKKLEDAGLLDKVMVLHISDPLAMQLAKEFKLKMAGSDIIDVNSNNKMTIEEFINLQKVGD